ncbi:MAG: right-handed parallel beta-helix repeat-containing protein, partial [Planctomycetota bacterium]
MLKLMQSLILTVFVFSASVSAETLYFSPTGKDGNPGTKEKPLKNPAVLRKLLKSKPQVNEILLAAGTYDTGVFIVKTEKVMPLTIRAEKGAEVIFNGGKYVTEAEEIKGAKGVYSIKGYFHFRSPPRLWEEDTRIRYREVEDLETVKAAEGTYCFKLKTMYFHTSDSKSFKDHKVGYGVHSYGIMTNRAKTIIKGIKFKNYQTRYRSSAVSMRAPDCVTSDCEVWNCRTGIEMGVGGDNCIAENIKISDCAGGVYTNGNNPTARYCEIIKTRDTFMCHSYEQDDAGIQYYYPTEAGAAHHNLIKGFSRSLMFKAKGNFVAEYNTVVDCKSGPWRSNNAAGDTFRYNIVYGCDNPFPNSTKVRPGTITDYNCTFAVANTQYLVDTVTQIQRAGTG